jgi:alkanesulfonate monooxygenase SsuD/methylene tetrahydromethanopterin reductase-like flavin-dependent oxidoreductase (luciferase family)
VTKVPDTFVDEVALVGSVERIRDRLAAWRESGATTLLVSTRDAGTLRGVAEAAS